MIVIKWKVINNNDYEIVKNDLLNTLLKNRGVENVEAFLNANNKNINHWSLLNNIEKAIKCLKHHIDLNSHIHIRIDPDADGYTSFTYIHNYLLKNFNVKCTYNTANKKEHGIIIKELKELEYFKDIDLFIIPDGGSFDYEAHKELIDLGKDIIILDHHSPEEGEKIQETKAIVVNPQLDNYPNKTLSGVGVAHKFCEGLDEKFDLNDSYNYLDLVSVGMVADNMDLRNLETRYYVLEGINQMKSDQEKRRSDLQITGNVFIQEIIKKKEDKKLKNINIDSIGWEIAPLLNGIARFGKQKEKIDTFRALTGEKEDRWYQPRRKKKTDPKPDKILKTLQEEMVRVCINAKSRQDRAKTKGVKLIEERIKEKKLNDNKILIIDGTDILEDSSLTGLVANGLANKYKKPCILLKKMKHEENMYGGSIRNYRMSPIPDFKKFLNESKMFNKVAGHSNAGGVNIEENKLYEIKNVFKKMLKDVTMEDVYLVDYQIPVGRLSKEQIIKVGKLKDIWGNTVPKPKFAITDIIVETKNIELIGKRKNVLKFKKKDLTFIRFFANEDLLNRMKMREKKGFNKPPKIVRMNIVGEFDINEYEGKEYPQINIVDFCVDKINKPIF